MRSLSERLTPGGVEAMPSTARRVGNVLLHAVGSEGPLAARRERLLEAAHRHATGVILQIGANDGLLDDPLRPFLLRHPGARAVLVEPQAEPYDRLRKLYEAHAHIRCIMRAIASEDGNMTLYHPRFGYLESQWGRALASSNKQHTARVLRQHPLRRLLGFHTITETVPALTLKTLLSELDLTPAEVSGFFCDTEGDDTAIVGQLLDTGARPSVLQYEYRYASPDQAYVTNNRLLELGYNLDFSYKDVLAHLG